MRAFVTLLPLIGCATARHAPPQWIGIAVVSGDKAEAQRQIERRKDHDPTGTYLIAKRWGLDAPPMPTTLAQLAEADDAQALALAKEHPRLRRAALLRLIQLKRYDQLAGLDPSPITAALAAQLAGDAKGLRLAMARAAKQALPSDDELRSFALLQRLRKPEPSDVAKKGWHALAVLRGPNEALRRVEGAPVTDCMARVTMALANEELGRRAAAAQALDGVPCLDGRLHRARLMAQLQPATARATLIELLDEAPLNADLLRTLRTAQGTNGDLAQDALARLVAWHPGDHGALRDQLTTLERAKEWAAAAQLCDRALHHRASNDLHLLALRYLALSGASADDHPRHDELLERLAWLRARAPAMKSIAHLDALMAGASEEGGALGAAQLQLKDRPEAGAPASD